MLFACCALGCFASHAASFFTSYSYMQEIVREWHHKKILDKGLEEHKEDYESMMREFQVTRPSHRARDHSAVEGC